MSNNTGLNMDPCGNPRIMDNVHSYLYLILPYGNGYWGLQAGPRLNIRKYVFS